MKKLFLVNSILILILSTIPILAQTGVVPKNIPRSIPKEKNKNYLSDVEKRKKQKLIVIEEILLDADNFKLAKDRAWAYARVGYFLCTLDKKRSNKMFKLAIDNYLFAKQNSEFRNKYPADKRYYGFSERSFISNQLKHCNPELALDYIYQTRPKNLTKDLLEHYKNPNSINKEYRRSLQSEITREENIKLNILRKKPQRASEFIQDNLDTTLNVRTIRYLWTLNRHNPKLATEFTNKIIKKLIESDFFTQDNKIIFHTWQPNITIANNFLRDLSKGKKGRLPIVISDELLSALAFKVVDETIKNKTLTVFKESLEITKRFYPNKAVEFEQMKSKILNSPERIELKRYKELTKNNPPNEILLSKVKSFSKKYQDRIYQLSACNMVAEKDYLGAKKLLIENYSNKQYPNKHLSLIIYSLALKSIKENKFAESEEFMENIPDAQLKIDALSYLAEFIFNNKKIKINKEKLLEILSKADEVYESNLDSINRKEAFTDIMTVYALIEPEMVFPIYDKFLNHSKPFKNNNVLSNDNNIEHIGYLGVSGAKNGFDTSIIVSRLKDKDFNKTLNIINKIKSRLSRVIVKGYMIQSYNQLDFDMSYIMHYCTP